MNSTSGTFLPKIVFAHKFSANEYHNHIEKRNHMLEIAIVTEGELYNEQNGKGYTAKQGDVICGTGLYDVTVDASSRHTHKSVCFLVDEDIMSVAEELPTVTHSPERTSSCLFLIDKIIQTHILESENDLVLSGLFLQLIGELKAINRQCRTRDSYGNHRYAEKAKKYIYEHISEPILQKDIADHLGITPEYLCAVFKKAEGRSVIRFINETKLTHIRTAMENMKISLGEASVQYGFSDPNYVSKLYKKYYNEPVTKGIKNQSIGLPSSEHRIAGVSSDKS